MKVKEVPQDNGMIGDHGQEICYAVNDKGEYQLTHSLGWEAKNVVNDQAWELIFLEVKKTHEKVLNNKLSPLAFHMIRNQMDPGLLGKYVSIAGWRVRRHLKSRVFKGLSESILSRYAKILDMSVDELKTVPKTIDIETLRNR